MTDVAMTHVPPAHLDKALPAVMSGLGRIAAGAQGRHQVADLVDAIRRDMMQLFVAFDATAVLAVCLTELRTYPQGRVARVVGLAGEQAARWKHLVAGIEEWARRQGCNAIELSAAPGWERLMRGHDYTKTHVLLRKDL